MAPELETSVIITTQHQETGQRVGSRNARPMGTRPHLPLISFKLGAYHPGRNLYSLCGGALRVLTLWLSLLRKSPMQALSKHLPCRCGSHILGGQPPSLAFRVSFSSFFRVLSYTFFTALHFKPAVCP